MKKNIIFGLLVVFSVYGCNYSIENKSNNDNKLKASIRLGWIPSASFSGEITGMYNYAAEHNLELQCEPGGPGLSSIRMVQAGENTFGTIAADEVFAANDKGADFIIIGLINYNSPGGFVSLKKNKIRTPKDFENKSVGVLPFGSTTLLYESLIKENNVNKKKISEIIVSSDLKAYLYLTV